MTVDKGTCAFAHCEDDGERPRLCERDGEIYRYCERHDPLEDPRAFLFSEVDDA
jgi:hypothetical protein